MSMQKTLGGDRLGAGKKMKVDLHGYERSTHDMGYLWRSTMSAGTLVPFLCEIALPGDTFDINLDCDIKTHPTLGPLFGSFKTQLDIFQAPIRLYQGQLHNNKLGIGLNMASVKLPQMTLKVNPQSTIPSDDPDNAQINPSCILSYLGIRGVAIVDPDEPDLVGREFNAIPLLAYWDIYKNYYANKQENIGYVIHKTLNTIFTTVTTITFQATLIPQAPLTTTGYITGGYEVVVTYSGASPRLDQLVLTTNKGDILLSNVAKATTVIGSTIHFIWDIDKTGPLLYYNWKYVDESALPVSEPEPLQFNLEDIDAMREAILEWSPQVTAFDVSAQTLDPYQKLLGWVGSQSPYIYTQEGLGLKTYQSDLFNNWLSTEWIDGSGGINDITAIDTSGGSFNIDTLNLSKKVYDMLNRIAVSGGTYDDWLDAVYTHDRYVRSESPIYHGGLIKELVFQEVVSNTTGNVTGYDIQPLGTLAGKGVMSKKHKGGQITIKVDEPSYIIGIVSLTPRIDYSQGNKWDTHLITMDDFHKPALDEIGFQELITEQMAWWTTYKLEATPGFIQRSAGKQPAWINYMTNVNQVRGNFAIPNNEMFMTLNRRYEWDGNLGTPNIQDLTTYIDPSKYNQIFAYTALDAQNYWTQIAVDITARRKMSAKIMPNL